MKDAMGRTALDWATARAQLSDMEVLIKYGSPIDTMDFDGRTTVLHAVDSHNTDVLRLLLAAGANPNPEMSEGLCRSSPLTAACYGGLVEMIKLLVHYGAKIDTCNPEGRNPLQTVASRQSIICADILLKAGANPNSISTNGNSPLMTAVVHSNHAVLKLFIDWCNGCNLQEIWLPPEVVECADEESISILGSANLLHVAA